MTRAGCTEPVSLIWMVIGGMLGRGRLHLPTIESCRLRVGNNRKKIEKGLLTESSSTVNGLMVLLS
jgi:hypothetical protein